jgi:ABC-2 type transport system ATP-binding protein
VTGSVIVARDVSKRYQHLARATSIKERLLGHKSEPGEAFWALKDFDLDIGHSETVGLIGPNGAGKSTILKVLSGILRPTSGTVEVVGRVASLLELGAGFNGELSGRENIYLNASLLGLSRREVDRLLESIVDFSEQESRLDDPVKHYSSGEYVKLGFAIAVHVDPDVLLVDEVLAVGDEAFQRKCLAKIGEFQDEGRTILLVTHALDLVEELCNRAVVINAGEKHFDGEPTEGVAALRKLLGTDQPIVAAAQHRGIAITDARLSASPDGPPVSVLWPQQEAYVTVGIEVSRDATYKGIVTASVIGSGHTPVWALRSSESSPLGQVPGHHVLQFHVPNVPPLNGTFRLSVAVTEVGSDVAVTAHAFDDLFTMTSNELPALVAVSYKEL